MQRRLCSCCACIDGRNFSYLFAAWHHFVSQLAFSSSSGLFGVPGQSTYAAGKIWMNFSGLRRDSATKIIISWPKALQATPLWMRWCHRSSGEVLGIDAEEPKWDLILFCFCAKISEVSISSIQCPQVGVRLEWWKIWELSPVLSITQNLRHIVRLAKPVSVPEFKKHQDMNKKFKEKTYEKPTRMWFQIYIYSHFSKKCIKKDHDLSWKGPFLVNTSLLSVMAWNVLVASWMRRTGEGWFPTCFAPVLCTTIFRDFGGGGVWGFPKRKTPWVC